MALDAFEEQGSLNPYSSVSKPLHNGKRISDSYYVGLLFATEEYKMCLNHSNPSYGYMTNTNVKFIAIMDFGDMKEGDLRKVWLF